MAETALRLQGFHQLLERQVLVRLRLQRALANLVQQSVEPHLPIDVGLEHLGVDEEPDQSLGFDPVAIGDRHADTDIRLTAVAIQQRLERCQQQHEGTRTLPLGKRLQPPGPLGAEFELQPRAAKALLRRTGTIERQLQHRLFATQQADPVRQLALPLSGLHPFALPDGIVRILYRQRRQGRFAPLAVGGIELDQLFDHQLHRPTVGDDMVLDHDQHMVIRSHFEQTDPQQRIRP
ncbi:hypothetical protein PA17_05878 [Pseudomonas aeruginosa]|nr:hypothetical protein OU9_02421 [Pseudomonas aeruginosa PAO1H2O]RCM84931.1 hypothetical protein PA17_05878 [Pseudomonas aeruginosa]